MEQLKANKGAGGGICTLIFIVFLTFKLTGITSIASWDWVWVTSPLWLPIAIIIIIYLVLAIFMFLTFVITLLITSKSKKNGTTN